MPSVNWVISLVLAVDDVYFVEKSKLVEIPTSDLESAMKCPNCRLSVLTFVKTADLLKSNEAKGQRGGILPSLATQVGRLAHACLLGTPGGSKKF